MNKKILYHILILFATTTVFGQCFTSFICGIDHVVAKKTDGTYWIWGSNNFGQMGQPESLFYYETPTLLPNNNFQSVTAGGYSTFVIKTNGTLWGTGGNNYGTLGVNSLQQGIYEFTQVGTANDWKNITPTGFFTIAMKTNNNIWGWGQNDGYQMGNATCCANQLTPTLISADTDWRSIDASGVRSAFAIKNNGTLWCWGSNLSYMLSSNSDRPLPVQHNPDTDWDRMSVGHGHILVIKTNGTLWAWGGGNYGETGDGLPLLYARYEPAQVGTATNWESVSAGFRTSFGIKTDGTLWAWGSNNVGQLGISNTTDQLFPVQVGTAANWAKVNSGTNFTVALKDDGSLWTWGVNFFGQLGNGTTTDNFTPTYLPVAGCALANEQFATDELRLVLNPNPVQNDLSIKYMGKENIDQIVIHDLLGKQVYSTDALGNNNFSTNLNISHLPSGSYIVSLLNKNNIVISKKLIKE